MIQWNGSFEWFLKFTLPVLLLFFLFSISLHSYYLAKKKEKGKYWHYVATNKDMLLFNFSGSRMIVTLHRLWSSRKLLFLIYILNVELSQIHLQMSYRLTKMVFFISLHPYLKRFQQWKWWNCTGILICSLFSVSHTDIKTSSQNTHLKKHICNFESLFLKKKLTFFFFSVRWNKQQCNFFCKRKITSLCKANIQD